MLFKKLALLFIVMVAGLGIYRPLNAAPINWRFVGDYVPEKKVADIKDEIPNINSVEDVSRIIQLIAERYPLKSVVANQVSNEILFEIKSAGVLAEYNINILGRKQREVVTKILDGYVGQVDSSFLRRKIQDEIITAFQKRGYFRLKIKLDALEKGGRTDKKIVIYYLTIDYSHPCLLSKISYSFSKPQEISPEVRIGDLCSMVALKEAARKFEEALVGAGYVGSVINKIKLRRNKNTNRGEVIFVGELGKLVSVTINDPKHGLSYADLFEEDEEGMFFSADSSTEGISSEVVTRYRNLGYEEAKVISVVPFEDNRHFKISIDVDSGPRFRLRRIFFNGVSQVSESDVRSAMDLTGWFVRHPIYSEEKFSQALENVKAFYREKGFWDVVVEEPELKKDSIDGFLDLIVRVNEGNRYLLSEIEITGISPEREKTIRSLLPVEVDAIVNPQKIIDFEKIVKEYFANQSFLHPKVSLVVHSQKGEEVNKLKITLNIKMGKRYKIGRVSIEGLVQTDSDIVERELYFKSGEYYKLDDIDESRRALLTLGLFQSIQIETIERDENTAEEGIIDIIIRLREAKPGNVSFGPGWSLFRGNRFAVEGSYLNIGGRARQVFARGRLSEESQQKYIGPKTLVGRSLSVGYLEPYLFSLPVNGTASVSTIARADETWLLTNAGETALLHRLRNTLRGAEMSVFYGQKLNREESPTEKKIGYLDIMGGNTRIGRIGLRFNYDKRDSKSWPTEGYVVQSEYSSARYVFGGDLAYRYWNGLISTYFEIQPKIVLALGGSVNAHLDLSRKKKTAILPVSETVFVGGSDTVRGFRERSLGPVVSYDVDDDENGSTYRSYEYVGGSSSGVYKLELRYQLSNSWGLSSFVDVGNSFFSRPEVDSFNREAENRNNESSQIGEVSRIEDNKPYNFSEIFTNPRKVYEQSYSAYGVAINYLTPLGAINLAYGLPWKRCAGRGSCFLERGYSRSSWLTSGVVHINVGATF